MKHLWSVAMSQANGISVAVCGARIDRLVAGEVIKEKPPFDCPDCMAGEASLRGLVDKYARPEGSPPVPLEPQDADKLRSIGQLPPTRKAERISFLERRRKAVIADMMIKVEGEDWHGVQDCASDLRDTDNELDGLRY